VFHVELRQFPHQARAFNLSREELETRILGLWKSRHSIELDERYWSPERARLTIYEGPRLETDQLGMGRGWGNVTRDGEDVTQRLLAVAEEVQPTAPAAELKRQVLDRCAYGPMQLRSLVELTGERYPHARLSERIALCEQAVWELLHEGELQLVRAGAATSRDDWQEVLLSWEAWRGDRVTVDRV
jgi:hypothetical protein